MASILPTHGVTFRVTNSGGSDTAFRLAGWEGVIPVHSGDGITLIDSLAYAEEDITLPITAIDDNRVLYSFGKNFGALNVTGTIYLFGCGSMSYQLSSIQNAFNRTRVSNSRSPKDVSALGIKCKVYYDRLEFFGADAKNQSVRFNLRCLIAPVHNKG